MDFIQIKITNVKVNKLFYNFLECNDNNCVSCSNSSNCLQCNNIYNNLIIDTCCLHTQVL